MQTDSRQPCCFGPFRPICQRQVIGNQDHSARCEKGLARVTVAPALANNFAQRAAGDNAASQRSQEAAPGTTFVKLIDHRTLLGADIGAADRLALRIRLASLPCMNRRWTSARASLCQALRDEMKSLTATVGDRKLVSLR